jgi:hypothetical protein
VSFYLIWMGSLSSGNSITTIVNPTNDIASAGDGNPSITVYKIA